MKRCIFLILIIISQNIHSQDFLSDYYIHGKITSGTTAIGLGGIEVKIYLFDDTWPAIADSIILATNTEGYFGTHFTGLKSEVDIENLGEVSYYQNKILSPMEGRLSLYDILGNQVFSQIINRGTNKLDLTKYANGIYLTKLEFQNETVTNKILKLSSSQYMPGAVLKEIRTEKKNLQKRNSYIGYFIDLMDPSGQYYNQPAQPWNGWDITSTDIEWNTSLLEKKDLDIPFTNPRNGEQVLTMKDFLFFIGGIDFLQYWAFFYDPRPFEIFFGRDSIPAGWNEQDIIDGTLEMLAATQSPVDTGLWREMYWFSEKWNFGLIK